MWSWASQLNAPRLDFPLSIGVKLALLSSSSLNILLLIENEVLAFYGFGTMFTLRITARDVIQNNFITPMLPVAPQPVNTGSAVCEDRQAVVKEALPRSHALLHIPTPANG